MAGRPEGGNIGRDLSPTPNEASLAAYTHHSQEPGSRQIDAPRDDRCRAEAVDEIRAHRLMDLAFRRQVPIAGYIVDFACPLKRLIVEVDGSQHADAGMQGRDQERSAKLAQDGWTVLRLWNDDVLRDIDGVCQHIVAMAGLDTSETFHPSS